MISKKGETYSLSLKEKTNEHLNEDERSQKEKNYISIAKDKVEKTSDKNITIAGRKLITDRRYTSWFKEDFQQGNVGNCYLISSFVAMKNMDSFKTLIQGSVSTGKYGSKSETCIIVRMPLGEPGGKDVYINMEELNLRKNNDRRLGINGAIGFKALELAYIKHRLSKGDDKNDIKYPGKVTAKDFDTIEGGMPADALETMLGNNNVDVTEFQSNNPKHQGLDTLKATDKQLLQRMLLGFNPEKGRNILLGSLIGDKKSDKDSIDLPNGKKIAYRHAYSVKEVKTDSKNTITKIIVQNPRQATDYGEEQYKDTIELSYNEFLRVFSVAQSCVTNSEFLNGKTRNQDVAVVVRKRRRNGVVA